MYMVRKKKGKAYKKPRKAPKNYKPRPNDRILDYKQTVKRTSLPRTRSRYFKVDGYDIEMRFKHEKSRGPLAGIRPGETRKVRAKNDQVYVYVGQRPTKKNHYQFFKRVKNEPPKKTSKKKGKRGRKK